MELGYWAIQGRAEWLRWLLAYLDIEYTEQHFQSFEEWNIFKDRTRVDFPFINLPFLRHGSELYSESQAIAEAIVRKASRIDLLGKDHDLETVRQYTGVASDLQAAFFSLANFTKEEIIEKYDNLFEEKFSEKFSAFEQLLGDDRHFLCYYVSVADFLLANVVFNLKYMAEVCEVEHELVRDRFGKLQAWYERVMALPGLKYFLQQFEVEEEEEEQEATDRRSKRRKTAADEDSEEEEKPVRLPLGPPGVFKWIPEAIAMEENSEFVQKLKSLQESLLQVCREIDVNDDGFISPEELQPLLQGKGELEPLVQEFEKVDKNGDGKVNYHEFLDHYLPEVYLPRLLSQEQREEMNEEQFDYEVIQKCIEIDKNGDGLIAVNELKDLVGNLENEGNKPPYAREKIDGVIESMEKNDEEKLQYREFLKKLKEVEIENENAKEEAKEEEEGQKDNTKQAEDQNEESKEAEGQ